MPFNFIRDILKEASINIYNPRTYVSIFTGRAFFQAFFNVLLTLPLGVYIRYLFKKDIKVTMLVCFLFSIFVEVTQLTGIYGIYKYPYRLFDVDNLMLNTLGGVIGFYIEPVFEYVLPSIEDLENKSVEYKKMASFTKRFIAFVLDWILFNLIFISEKTSIVSFLIFSFIYFMLVPYITKGVTFGCFIVGIRIKSTKETLSLLSLFKRYGMIIYIFFGVNKLLLVIGNFLGVSDSNIILLFMLIQLAIDITCIINIITHVKRNDKILIFDKLSNTYIVSK
nr:VanZ family protein [Clostridium cuniculi]